MPNAIKAIYNDVSCCVRINGVKTDFFDVSTGLKQGCLLSPLLFNLFLNDLSQEIRNCGRGVNIEDEIISLYYMQMICVLYVKVKRAVRRCLIFFIYGLGPGPQW